MKTILKTRQNGFAIIEALIAFLLLGIGVAALIYLQGNLMVGSSTSKARAEAMEIAKDRAEVLRNHIDKGQYLSALGSVSDESVAGVNATYTVSYTILQDNAVIDVDNPLTTDKTQNLTVKVSWTGSEENSEEVALETMLYFMSPTIASNLGSDGGGEGSARPPLVGPWISGEEGKDPSTAPIKLADDKPGDNDIATADDTLLGIEINRYIVSTGALTGRSNVEVLYDTDGDGVKEVVLTSFGGIVHKIKGKVITDRFSVPLDADNDGILDVNELRNFWIDDGGVETCAGTGTADDGFMQENEVKYWIDGANGGTVDGVIQDIEYTCWVDDDPLGTVQTSEFDPPEATARANSILVLPEVCDDITYSESHPDECDQLRLLNVIGSPPSFCLFPICDDDLDTDHDCEVPVNDPTNDDDPENNDVDEYGIASYVCYVPGDCTYQDDYVANASGSLNGCPVGFIQPADDDFDDLNGGWYGRIGNFGIKLNPDDMVCTADTTKTHLTPSREYVTYRYVDSSKTTIIGNEGINTPYSNQTFIIARKNNKPSVYCPIRALSYEGNLVNEQIKRELTGAKVFDATGQPTTTTPDWEKNVVLPENVCTTGLSCP